MSAIAEKVTQLTVIERAQQALCIQHTEAELKKMARCGRNQG